jgi:hypothetical protein
MLFKYFTFIIILGAALVLSGCKKDTKSSAEITTQELTSAKAFFVNQVLNRAFSVSAKNYRAKQDRSLQWEEAKQVALSTGPAIVVPVHYQKQLYVSSGPSGDKFLNLNDLTKVVITKDSTNSYHYVLWTFIPDTSALSSGSWSSGIVLSEDWQGNAVAKPRQLRSRGLSEVSDAKPGTKEVDVLESVQVCSEIDGYNYSSDDPSDGFAWSENTCSSYSLLVPDLAPIGGSYGDIPPAYATSPLNIAYTVEVPPPPKNPIGNISAYFSCFTQGDAGHSFSVTLAVEQPVPGTRTPWALTRGGVSGSSAAGNLVDVGHTWLIFTETTPYGTITRNVGFYPISIVSPGFRTAQGVLADDETTPYNIALTIPVNSDQFFGMLNSASQGNSPGYMYDLNQNNCTTYSLDILDQYNVSVPSVIGRWAGNGQGLDPGDLGEDIRAMQIPSNWTKFTVSNFHPNTGNCN